jgi:hypothetical protein
LTVRKAGAAPGAHTAVLLPQGQWKRPSTMDVSTQLHLPFLREQLSARLHELQTDLSATQQQRRGDALAADSCEVSDRKDEAAQEQRSQVNAAEQRARCSAWTMVSTATACAAASRSRCSACVCNRPPSAARRARWRSRMPRSTGVSWSAGHQPTTGFHR